MYVHPRAPTPQQQSSCEKRSSMDTTTESASQPVSSAAPTDSGVIEGAVGSANEVETPDKPPLISGGDDKINEVSSNTDSQQEARAEENPTNTVEADTIKPLEVDENAILVSPPLEQGATTINNSTEGQPPLKQPTVPAAAPVVTTAPTLTAINTKQQETKPINSTSPSATNPQVAATTGFIAACKTCMVAVVEPKSKELSVDMLQTARCPKCAKSLWLPGELLRFFSLFGYYVPTDAALCMLFTAMSVPESDLPTYTASLANILTQGLQTNYVYDVAIPKGKYGLGMKIQKIGEDVVVGGFTCSPDGAPGPAKLCHKISVGDKLVAVNKESIDGMSFEQQVKVMSQAASPIYLTFKRKDTHVCVV